MNIIKEDMEVTMVTEKDVLERVKWKAIRCGDPQGAAERSKEEITPTAYYDNFR